MPVFLMRDTMCMAQNLGKMLTTGKKTRGIKPTNKGGVIKVNSVTGSARAGQTYIEATVGGQKIHRYALNGSKDVKFAPDGSTVSKAAKVQASVPQALSKAVAGTPAVPASNGLVNQIKSSSRYGQTYTQAVRKGVKGHLYANGKFVPMGKS